ncbi:antiapoptotic membrane protein [Deerpox virus W-848-83]|uniref:Apoptosis regulator DPV022 n=1 Tax=Deerpox virus (strain Mule deer/United States/W-848-83/1983) TaxID=305674 RepID=DPV22_DPV83|nr:Antiapoptotic membrane protein [Deerpox virus W-848-83]Q08FX8.1 RecName: Full=Apoptosis regulator DPV022 [Deerpox virus W-848-83]ABI99179.1 antiapoptotic membrane protein [Deerpox virus W-848-83]
MEAAIEFDEIVKKLLNIYINDICTMGEKRLLNNYEKSILDRIYKSCEYIKKNYELDFNSMYNQININDITTSDIKSKIIESLLIDSRPSVKLATLSFISLIAEKWGEKNRTKIMEILSNEIVEKISNNGKDFIDFIDRDDDDIVDDYVLITNYLKITIFGAILGITAYYICKYLLKSIF